MKAKPDDLPEDEDSREIAALYREISGEQPSPRHDAAVLAAARADLAAAKSRKPWLLRWKLPLALAATVALTASLTLTVEREQSREDSVQRAQELPAAPAASPAPSAVIPRAKTEPYEAAEKEQLTLQRALKSAARAQVQQKSEEAKPIEPSSANAPAAPQASAEPSPARDTTRSNAQSGLFSRLFKPAPPSPVPEAQHSIGIRGTAGPQSEPSESQAHANKIAPAAPPPPPAKPEPVAPQAYAPSPPVAADKREAGAVRPPVVEPPTGQVAAPAPLAKPAFVPEPAPTASAPLATPMPPPPAPAPVAAPAPTAGRSAVTRDVGEEQLKEQAADVAGSVRPRLSPADWVAKIRALRKDGHETEAQAELKQLRLAYPDFPVPKDLLAPPAPAAMPTPPPGSNP